ncbi:MAG: glutamine synthetase type III, partial [Chitinophagales bacterium]|nr:glutamine synthetase type III [Chitinophagales bacterium]
ELEKYIKIVQIESRIIGELVMNQIVPVAIQYENELINNIRGHDEIGLNVSLSESQRVLVAEISGHVNTIVKLVNEMTEARKVANHIEDIRERAIAYCDLVKPSFEEIRYHTDKLELIIDDKLWPLPKYRELLFMR